MFFFLFLRYCCACAFLSSGFKLSTNLSTGSQPQHNTRCHPRTKPPLYAVSSFSPHPPLNSQLTILFLVTLEDRLILKTKLLTHLSTHPALQFPSPSLPPKDRRIPSHLSTSNTSYIPYSALLSSVHKAPMKLPLTGQQWHWLRKFCYPSFFYKGPSTSGFQELQPRGFLRLTLTERAFVRSEMGKANGQVRARVVPQGVMVVAM